MNHDSLPTIILNLANLYGLSNANKVPDATYNITINKSETNNPNSADELI